MFGKKSSLYLLFSTLDNSNFKNSAEKPTAIDQKSYLLEPLAYREGKKFEKWKGRHRNERDGKNIGAPP